MFSGTWRGAWHAEPNLRLARHRRPHLSANFQRMDRGLVDAPPDLIAMICIFHGANRSWVASCLNKNGIEPSLSLCALKKIYDPAHELVPAVRSSPSPRSTCTVALTADDRSSVLELADHATRC